jgi:hypothetical protein
MNPNEHDKLEHLIHRTLRDLPPRRAPQSLEMRVLAAIEQRAALPWWRKSYVHWPVPARAAFLAFSVGLVVAAVWMTAGLDITPIRDAFASEFGWLKTLSTVATATVDFLQAIIRSIPSLWLYGGLAFVAAMYVALFGLSAAAYRTLYASR